MSSRTLTALLVSTVLLACGAPDTGTDGDGIDDAFGIATGKADGSLSDAEIAGVLAVANTVSFAVLDDDVGLDRRAAEGIVARRDAAGTFADLAALDAVPWVGPVALADLLEYAHAHGFVAEEVGDACLLISEYAEGSGNNNKALEVYNCGDEPIALGERSLCLVRNDDVDCTLDNAFSAVELAAGHTWVVCRTRGGTFNDPMQSLRDRCDQEMPGVMTMSGDDRYAVLDHDGTVLDAFGRLAWRPGGSPWANIVLRRCDLQPYDGIGWFTTQGHYTAHSGNTHVGLGLPPTAPCP